MPNRFKPSEIVNNAPTAELGAPVIDVDGNVLGGNSRAMMLHRIYGAENPKARENYLSKLRDDAAAFGLDPDDVSKFDHPVLVRKVTDSGYDKQQAITDLNKVSVTTLKQDEQAIAEGHNLTPEVLDSIQAKAKLAGSDATVSDFLNRYGTDIVDELHKAGSLSKGEMTAFLEKGDLTAAGKERLKQMLTGHVFAELEQLQYLPDSYRDALGRTVLPLIKTEKSPEWDLIPATREALDLLTEHAQKGKKQNFEEFTRQISTLQPNGWSDRAIAIANKLREGVSSTAAAYNTYAGEFRNADEGSMFGALPPDEAFDLAFKNPVEDGSLMSVADVVAPAVELAAVKVVRDKQGRLLAPNGRPSTCRTSICGVSSARRRSRTTSATGKRIPRTRHRCSTRTASPVSWRTVRPRLRTLVPSRRSRMISARTAAASDRRTIVLISSVSRRASIRPSGSCRCS
jgi:hypothetical protein